ncbi:MAG TPA: Mov34/MPN/PAD-1 family protein [Terriglobia bacterium]|nr:Mov34/MPN/PAD-1 family protein [Terriglobia bacterium]
MDVYISANAFWALLVSAIEVYKKECFGILLGYRDSSNIYIIEHALSYQTARRTHGSVEKNKRASKRIQSFLDSIPHLSMIGDFHSHTGWGDLKGVGHLSQQDITDMTPEDLSIILVVNDKRRNSAWQYNGDGTLSGTVDKYHFRVGAYYLDEHSKTRRANIFCPYAIGFNAKEIPQRVFMRTSGANPRWLRSKS